ncbi:tetratricopeptide repeat protein, partial [bacterium]|nr:tetratricopeptide repeat protein [bacterium]
EKENRYQSTGEIGSELTRIEQGITTTQRVEPKRKPLTSKEITVSFSPKKIFIPALVLLALLVITFVLWQVFFHKETRIPWEERPSVAVISFENLTGDKTYDHLRKIIPNLLITSLEQSGYFQVTTWERMRDILKQMGKPDVEFIDQDLGFELSLKEGIDAIVLGSFGKAGNVFVTDVKVLDAVSKKLLRSASSKGQGEGSILNTQIDQLSPEISRGIGISKEKIEAAQTKITDVTTTSTEAYNYYLQGRQADEKFYHEEARRFFEKAIEIDPQFVSAYLAIVLVYGNLGDTNAMNKALDSVIALADKASRKEKLIIEAQYYLFRERNWDKTVQSMEHLIEEFPKEKSDRYYLGVIYYQSNKFDQAIEQLNKALELDPDFPDALNMIAYVFSEKGNFEKAIEYFKRYASVLPGAANPLDSLAELYFKMGRLEDAAAKYQEALAIKPDFSSRL